MMKMMELLLEDDAKTGGPHAEQERDALGLMDEAKNLVSASQYAQASDLLSKAASILARISADKVNYGTNT